MQIVSQGGDNFRMKGQILFSRKNKNISLSSAEFVHSMVNINPLSKIVEVKNVTYYSGD